MVTTPATGTPSTPEKPTTAPAATEPTAAEKEQAEKEKAKREAAEANKEKKGTGIPFLDALIEFAKLLAGNKKDEPAPAPPEQDIALNAPNTPPAGTTRTPAPTGKDDIALAPAAPQRPVASLDPKILEQATSSVAFQPSAALDHLTLNIPRVAQSANVSTGRG